MRPKGELFQKKAADMSNLQFAEHNWNFIFIQMSKWASKVFKQGS